MRNSIKTGWGLSVLALAVSGCSQSPDLKVRKIEGGNKPRNVIFILSDDHRYDYMGFLDRVPWLETPAMDFMAENGAYVENAFVTTSLSSPSRASILTSLFSHEHTVVDNVAPTPEGLVYFPQYLQQAGYATAFFGKWHMGDTGWDPQPGFDHWEALKGQGTYQDVKMNVDGKIVTYDPKAYVAELLTDHALEFIDENKDKPFFVYLSHKSVHEPFTADKEYLDAYKDEEIPLPASYDHPEYGLHQLPSKGTDGHAARGKEWYGEGRTPDWVKNQRESWHGVDYCYHGKLSFEEECRKYCECVSSLDSYIQEVLDYLKKEGLDQSTMVIYMGDNGFCWGEHGLIDKRNFYEASARVPMLVYCPELIKPGTVVKELVQNIDIAPTIMEACGLQKAEQMRGESFIPLLQGKKVPDWRKKVFYEYYWEYDFPHTPTTFGVRTDRYKYIRYHGVWDTNEFYDLQEDPEEMHNLIDSPEHQKLIKELAGDIYEWQEETGGMKIPLKRTVKHRWGDHRNIKVY